MQAHERKALSQARLEHAVECLSAARNLLETGNYKSAANRWLNSDKELIQTYYCQPTILVCKDHKR